MKKTLYLITVLLMVTTSSGCKKDNKLSKEEYLTRNQWKVVGMTVDPGFPIYEQDSVVGYQTDLWKDTPACIKDNFYDFKKDGTVISSEGPTKCEESDPQQVQGDWSFNEDKSVLIYISPWNNLEYRKIEKLDDDEFVVSMNDTIEDVIHLITVYSAPRQ